MATDDPNDPNDPSQQPADARADDLTEELARRYDPDRLLKMVSKRAGKGERLDHSVRAKPYMYWYYPKALPQADRAAEGARQPGKEECPSEFNAAKDLKEKAYEFYASCRDKEAIAMANEAKAKADALCPRKAVAEVKPEPKPEPIPSRNLSLSLSLSLSPSLQRS